MLGCFADRRNTLHAEYSYDAVQLCVNMGSIPTAAEVTLDGSGCRLQICRQLNTAEVRLLLNSVFAHDSLPPGNHHRWPEWNLQPCVTPSLWRSMGLRSSSYRRCRDIGLPVVEWVDEDAAQAPSGGRLQPTDPSTHERRKYAQLHLCTTTSKFLWGRMHHIHTTGGLG